MTIGSCTTKAPHRPLALAASPGADPLAGGLAALAAGRRNDGARLLSAAATRYPPVEDLTLYFRARSCASAGESKAALDHVRALLARHPDSIWAGPARLTAGQVCRRTGDLASARQWLTDARATLPMGKQRWVRATWLLADLEHTLGDDEAALALATSVRQSEPHGPGARRARRLSDRMRGPHPPPEARVTEGELRLREGDAAGARAEVAAALAGELDIELQQRALWTRAQAEHALGLGAAAEGTCLTLASDGTGSLPPRALAAVAGWRWNGDDDAGALALFRTLTVRFPTSAQAPEALYAIGRIHQEAGRYREAAVAYTDLGTRFPTVPLVDEARWRVGFVRYLAGDHAGAAAWFGRLAAHTRKGPRAAAEYWEARSLERLGRPEAAARFAHVAEHHRRSYYGALAAERLGHVPPPLDASGVALPRTAFPPELDGVHAERARLLAGLGLVRFARQELDAVRAPAPDRRLLEAYSAVGAPGAALRLAREIGPETRSALRPYLYPLAYWEAVRAQALASGVDPLLVESIMRQESLFEPEAVSPADARGLMQLLPRTARDVAAAAGRPPPDLTTLHEPDTNIDLGVLLLRHLLDRYGGSRVKAVAAYNAGEDAVAKWEQRYASRSEDEFVELISYRETRDYVKAVLRNYQTYRLLYVEGPGERAPSASATSRGSPPNAPFDMIAMTSPRFAEATR